MATGLGEFFISILVDSAKGELSIQGLVKQMGALEVAGIAELEVLEKLADKLVELTKAAMETAEGLDSYSASTGASIYQLQKWQGVAGAVGISGGELAKSMEGVSQALVGMRVAGESSPLANLFQRLHLNWQAFKDSKPEEVLKAVRENMTFQGLSPAEQQFWLQRGGLGGLQQLLTKHEGGLTDNEFRKFWEDVNAMTEKQKSTFSEMHKVLYDIGLLVKGIGQDIASWFGPVFLGALKLVADSFRSLAEVSHFITKSPNLREAAVLGPTTVVETALQDYIGDFLTRQMANHPELRGTASPISPVATPEALLVAASAAPSRTVTANQTNTVNVKGGPHMTPQQFEKSVEDAMSRAWQRAAGLLSGAGT